MARSTLDDFVLKEKLGSGSYGVVWKVLRKVDQLTYACKEVDLNGMTRKEQEECIRETQILSNLDSEYIIKYYDSFLEKGKLYIVTEYASNGNLHDFIKAQSSRLPEELIWRLALQMLLGLNHMHKRKILHRDFKTLNVFLDQGINVKLGDMGVAKILSTQTAFARTIVGTPYYLSPELCEDKPYNEKSDVWALGVTLYECCTQRHPFDADNQGALILKILRGKFPAVPTAPSAGGYSKELVDIVKACLTLDARKRPDTEKLLSIKSLRDRAAELGIQLPPAAQSGLLKPVTLSVVGGKSASADGTVRRSSASSQAAGIRAARPPVAGRPRSATQAATAAAGAAGTAAARRDREAVQSVTELPTAPAAAAGRAPLAAQAGVIRVTGDMNAPPLQHKPPSRSPSKQKMAVPPFVFGNGGAAALAVAAAVGAAGAAAANVPAVHVSIRQADTVTGEGAEAAGPDGTRPLHPQWSISGSRAAGDGQLEEESASAAGVLEPEASAFATPERSWVEDADDGPQLPIDDGSQLPTASSPSGSSASHTPPNSDRSHRLAQALPLLRAECVSMVGQRAFDALHMLLRMQADSGSHAEGDDGDDGGALRRSVLKIVPESKLGVVALMAKLLYLEGQVGERQA